MVSEAAVTASLLWGGDFHGQDENNITSAINLGTRAFTWVCTRPPGFKTAPTRTPPLNPLPGHSVRSPTCLSKWARRRGRRIGEEGEEGGRQWHQKACHFTEIQTCDQNQKFPPPPVRTVFKHSNSCLE